MPHAVPTREERDARRAEAAGPSLPETYGAVVEEIVRKYRRPEQQKVRWQEPHRILLREGKRWLKRPVASIAKREIYNLLDQIMKRVAPYTANRTYAGLKMFFVWCVCRDVIEVNPMAGLTKPFANEQPRKRVYNDAEIRSIWEAVDKLRRAHGSFLKCRCCSANGRPRSRTCAGRRLKAECGRQRARA